MSRKFLSPLGLLAKSTDPASGSIGDTYYNTGDNKVYTYNGSSWEVTLGTQGTQGTTGTGSQGTQGFQGTTGTGTQGLQGTSGNTIIFTGFDGGDSSTTQFDLSLDLGAAV